MPNDRSPEPAPMAADAVLKRLREALGLQQDTELAQALGVPYSTLTSWKRRKSVPLDSVAALCCAKNISLDWIYFGRMALPKEDSLPAHVALMKIAGQYALAMYKIDPLSLKGFPDVLEHMYMSVLSMAQSSDPQGNMSAEEMIDKVAAEAQTDVQKVLELRRAQDA